MNSSISHLHQKESFDVVIIGGGINGIGCYRELALQGLKVLLVEKDDFCSKASSAPSRMIHGGLRYLENGEFSLVQESITERNRLLENAPHQVKPLRTVVPLTSYLSGILDAGLRFLGVDRPTKERGAFIVKVGLWFYDVITRGYRVMPKHEFLNKTATKKSFPSLRPAIQCAGVYYDAWIVSPERLAMELLSEGNEIQKTQYSLNYTRVETVKNGRIELRCLKTGEAKSVNAPVIVNATGSWIDFVNQDLGLKSEYTQGTKGSHIIVDNPELLAELNDSMVYYENDENRVCIMFPYQGKVLIGSTDLPITNPDEAVCTDEEVDYILASFNYIFPKIKIDRNQILYKFSGVRPLGKSTAASAGKIPRSHQLLKDQIGPYRIFSLVGGKWTTFRAFAEETADEVLKSLGVERKTHTRNRPIGGGREFPKNESESVEWIKGTCREFAISEQHCRLLLDRYGTQSVSILRFAEGQGLDLLPGASNYFLQELNYIIKHEYVVELTDVLVRRTNMAIEGWLNEKLVSSVAVLMANKLGWSADHIVAQVKRSVDVLASRHGCDLNKEIILNEIENCELGESVCS